MMFVEEMIKEFIDSNQPIKDPFYGEVYRCSLDLEGGIHLPAAILISEKKYLKTLEEKIREDCLEGKQFLV